jgi:hypothetical protein
MIEVHGVLNFVESEVKEIRRVEERLGGWRRIQDTSNEIATQLSTRTVDPSTEPGPSEKSSTQIIARFTLVHGYIRGRCRAIFAAGA